MFKKFSLAAAAAATALVALPTAAQARHNDYGSRYDRYEQRYDDRYQDRRYDSRYDDRYSRRGYDGYDDRTYRGDRRCSGTTGTIVGGVGGALAGRAIDRSGSRYSRGGGTTGAIIGGAIGALVGRSVDKSSCNNSGRYYR
jgi:hypothetical protein